MRKTYIAGNWKMNMGLESAKELLNEIKNVDSTATVVVCPPFTMLPIATEILKDSNIFVGAQNMNYNESGAYTGEIAPDMLVELGVKFVILGHSERRTYYGETDEDVNKKVLKAIEKGLTPIVCVGETLEQRESGNALSDVNDQVKKALCGVEDVTKVVIAYEPIWAIGTGKTATPQDANEVMIAIRNEIRSGFGDACEDVSILYGGSMNENNVCALMEMSDIDGGLIGGASLKSEKFTKLMTYDK